MSGHDHYPIQLLAGVQATRQQTNVFPSWLPYLTPLPLKTHSQKRRLERKASGNPPQHTHAQTKTHTYLMTDTVNKLSFELMFSVYSVATIPLSPQLALSFVLFSSSSLFFSLYCLCSRCRAYLSNQYWRSTSRKPRWLNMVAALNQSDQQRKRLLLTEVDATEPSQQH